MWKIHHCVFHQALKVLWLTFKSYSWWFRERRTCASDWKSTARCISQRLEEEYKIFEEAARERIIRLLKGQESNGGGTTKRGDKLSEDVLSSLELVDLLEIQPSDEAICWTLNANSNILERKSLEIDEKFAEKEKRSFLQAMNSLPASWKLWKFILLLNVASNQVIRWQVVHGNKGVVSNASYQ